MLKEKRVGVQSRSTAAEKFHQSMPRRLLDSARFWYRQKLDFCRMGATELIEMVNEVSKEDRRNEIRFRPPVPIGHTKDLVDMKSVDLFLEYLEQHRIPMSTLGRVYQRCTREVCCTESSLSEALIRHV